MSQREHTEQTIAALLERAVDQGGLDAAASRQLRAALLAAGPTRATVDGQLATAWRAADADARVHGLRDALEGLVLGTALVAALLDSIDGGVDGGVDGGAQAGGQAGRAASAPPMPNTTAATREDETSANAALWVLREAADDALDPRGWRRVGRVARAERAQAVPDLEAELLLAERGPAACGASLALIAFRDGPEDALDRLAALAALGRFADLRPTDLHPTGLSFASWLHGVVASGGAVMEAVQALSFVAVRAHEAGDEAQLETVLAALLVAAGVHDTEPDPAAQVVGDGWTRWLALDLLSRLLGEAAVPMLQAAHAAGGQYDVPWLLPQLAARVRSLGGTCPAPPDATLPYVAPLPSLETNLHSRSPRVARRAAALANERLAAGSPATGSPATGSPATGAPPTDAAALRAALLQRGGVEQALVARGQLLASFIVSASPADGQEGALSPDFRPWSALVSDAERAELIAVEAAWLD